MSVLERYARYRRRLQDNAAWRLLRANNAPLILAFISQLFEENNDVVFSRAKAALELDLSQWREEDWFESEKSAAAYLREWIQSGWLRESDDHLSKTDACETALRFCESLDKRDNKATASHLRIVQNAVRDLAAALSPNSAERITLLESRKAELQREIDDLNAGIIKKLSDAEQRERIREVYQLASVLTGDFRRVEDEIRQLDQDLRVSMIESDSNRGEVLQNLLEKEELLSNSDAGRAFEGFFQLLCDQNRNMEFREQLRSLLSRAAAQYLRPDENRFLGQLVRELTRESERVFKVRRRTEESLRAYVESGAHLENRKVEQLLGKLERIAVRFKDQEFSLNQCLPLELLSGKTSVRSPQSMRLCSPDEQLDTSEVQAKENSGTPSQAMLEQLHAVKIVEVATRMRSLLQQQGPLSIGGLIKLQPVTSGLEELVAFLRVAKAVGAAEMDNRETVEIEDRKGEKILAKIPGYLMSAQQFPQKLEELVL
ncbi:MAG: DUF3375 domain-containing protein [Gammaproteobacteria bacterium]|nr:DUF3375 domain-containing protein [Gammaproteobacteria bacterium]MDH5803071.1 DUF3375 domain-containing protein [Gammaproteobacteria bacterium]